MHEGDVMLPTPYYARGGVELYHGRMEEILPHVPAKHVDLILTDPPYAESTHAGARTHPKKQSGQAFPSGPAPKLLTFDSFTVEQQRAAFDAMARVARGWVISFLDWHHVAAFDAEPPAGLRFIRFGVWVKPNSAPQFSGDRPGQGWEALAIMHTVGGRMHWNGGGNHGVWVENKAHRSQGSHPTSKPLPLIKRLIQDFSNHGDLVLDPFGGGGTTARACFELGRHCISIEADERYCHAAARALETAAEPPTWLDAPVLAQHPFPMDV